MAARLWQRPAFDVSRHVAWRSGRLLPPAASFSSSATQHDRHPRSKPLPPYVPPPPFPPVNATAQQLLEYREPPLAVPPIEDPLLQFITNLIMRRGKRTVAQRHVRDCLQHLRLVTGQEPLPLLRRAVEIASPHVRMMSEKKAIKLTLIPVPLNERQRTRKAIVWMLKFCERRSDKRLGARLALEVIAVLNGNSEALRQKTDVHKLAVVNRSNVKQPNR